MKIHRVTSTRGEEALVIAASEEDAKRVADDTFHNAELKVRFGNTPIDRGWLNAKSTEVLSWPWIVGPERVILGPGYLRLRYAPGTDLAALQWSVVDRLEKGHVPKVEFTRQMKAITMATSTIHIWKMTPITENGVEGTFGISNGEPVP